MYGVREFSAIINPPHATILAVGATRRAPVEAEDGSVKFISQMTVTLSCDHSVVDGALGAELLACVQGFHRKTRNCFGVMELVMAGEKPDVLMVGARKPVMMKGFEGKVNLHHWLDLKDKDAFVKEYGGKIRAIAIAYTANKVDENFLKQFPKLEQVSSFGVGYDHIDAKWAGAHGIIVTNTPDVLNEEVADTAIGLLLCTVREFPQSERFLRAGKWPQGHYPLTKATLRDRTVGMVGMGRIGKEQDELEPGAGGNAVRLESRSDQRELIAEPTTRAFTDNQGVPAPPGIFQRREQLRSCRPPVPRDGSRLPEVEVLFDDRTATRTDELLGVLALPGARRLRVLIVLRRTATVEGTLRSLLIGQVFDAADSDQFIENRPRVIGRGGHRSPLASDPRVARRASARPVWQEALGRSPRLPQVGRAVREG